MKAHVVLVPPEQSADLRDYYSKHTKSGRLDSRMMARLPLLHPEGLRAAEGIGPADPMRRATKLRAELVKRRTMIVARLDCYLELLGPQWHRAFGGDLVNNTPLQLLASGDADPHTLRQLGRARLIKFLWRYSHGAWGESHAATLIAAADETLKLWDDEIDFGELADDIADGQTTVAQFDAEGLEPNPTRIRDPSNSHKDPLADQDQAGIKK